MSQKRMLHANIWESVQFTSLSRDARLFFIGLITIADDDGRFKANCSLLRSKIFPLDEEVTTKDVAKLLEETVNAGLISTYKIEEETFGVHPNWEKYQTLRADRKKDSSIPPPPSIEAIATKRQPNDNQVATKRPHKIREDKIREGNVSSADAPTPKTETKTFKKPTLDEVTAYCGERRNRVNPQKWYNHYESNGWRVGRNPMKDWRAAIRTWEQSEFGVGNSKPDNVLKTDNRSKLVKAMEDKAKQNS